MADGCRAFATQPGLPSSNRGVSGFSDETRTTCCIDWFAASVDLLAVLREQLWPENINETIATLNGSGYNARLLASYVFSFFFGGYGMQLAEEVGKGRFYSYRVPITNAAGDFVGQIELGGVHTVRKDGSLTCRLELTGDGCRLLSGAGTGHAKRWLVLRAQLESTGGRLTRLDVAIDDLDGLFPIETAISWREGGKFDRRGQRPKARLYDDFGSGDGKTLYVGSPTSEQQLRAYEKGKQLGDRESPWMRYEAQFTASSRKELSLDMLREPEAYLLGQYPVLREVISFMRVMAQRIDVTDEAMRATWKSCRRHLKRQYGATLAFLVKHTPSDEALARVIRTLTSPKLPAWADNEAANSWPEIVAVQENA